MGTGVVANLPGEVQWIVHDLLRTYRRIAALTFASAALPGADVP
jgi:hypothetical protein